MAAVPVAVGEVIAGKYRVERVIGSGGMGMVVAAWHVQLDQLVAVKLLHSETAGSGDATERFRREARSAARIRSEHVARVIDVGIWTGGIPYIVMEYLDGNDLAAELAMRGPLPAEECVEYVMQAIEALAEAHAVGIVHRDLKPGNLFLARRPDGTRLLKVLDFGISKHAQAGEVALTRTSSLIGSPLYMSPEQMRSARTVDARADIWSLGAIMFELLAGNPPFGGETVIEACTAILNDELPSLSALRPDVPPYLENVIRRCLEKERDNRYQSIGDLATDLANFSPASRLHADRALRVLGGSGSRASGQHPISLPGGLSTPSGSNPIAASVPTPSNQALVVSPAGTPPPVAGTPHTSASWEATGAGSKTRRWPIVVMVGAVLAVIAAVGYREFSPGPASGPPPETPSAVAPVEVAPPPAPPEVAPTIDPPAVSAVPSVAPAESSLPASSSNKPRPATRPVRRPDGAKGSPKSDGISDFGGRR
jgi:eukaryotic-like serine/threonine-protein kinase